MDDALTLSDAELEAFLLGETDRMASPDDTRPHSDGE